MDEQKQKLIERISQAQNILVTVSTNPTVDQLSAAIGLTLALNKLDKHGTAVFSGQVPSTLEFLKPEETLEKNTDSLRDFIIALDKSKADKLRYKVEDQVVRIFITPYKTSLSQADLNFSQGDFNVDVVIALGVTEQQDLDAAIVAHGRILHDATVASVTTTGQGSLGTINWVDPGASSLSEMVAGLIDGLDKKVLDNQIATALLTGIVASTERFSNDKTTPKTMSASAALMIAGANQQLIATQLETPPEPEPAPEPEAPAAPGDNTFSTDSGSDANQSAPPEPGMLEINHDGVISGASAAPEPAPPEPDHQIQVDADGQLHLEGELPTPPPIPQISQVRGVGSSGQPTEGGSSEVKRELMVEPPKLGDSAITANSTPEGVEQSAEELTLPAVNSPMLSHNESVLAPLPEPGAAAAPAPGPLPSPLSSPSPLPDPASVSPVPALSSSFAPPALPAAPAVPTPSSPFQVAPPVWQPPAPIAPAPAPFVAPAPGPDSVPAPGPVAPSAPAPSPPGTLADIEQSVGSPHVQISEEGTFTNPNVATAPVAATGANVDTARSAVESAYNHAGVAPSPSPIAALNAHPLGPDLHADETLAATVSAPASAAVTNPGFSEPTPGNTPADNTLDMPLPSNPFGPGQQFTPPAPVPTQAAPSAFPGAPAPGSSGPLPPPVPPPMVPPLPH